MHSSDIIATAPAGEYLVRIEGLRKSFGDLEVLRDVNLDVAPGEVVTIIGMMEVLRGGIESVDAGQMEAARSLGLSQWEAMRKVVFPQGVKFAIPGLSNELVINI